ncbi:hypothetical protein BGX34_009489 [Mortierella sp. NVP85]|nr:hypothetical protein BGX34_009489 [Mortierella sp. NVP85]
MIYRRCLTRSFGFDSILCLPGTRSEPVAARTRHARSRSVSSLSDYSSTSKKEARFKVPRRSKSVGRNKQLKEPWRGLVDSLMRIHRGENAFVPSIENDDQYAPNLGEGHTGLRKQAIFNLQEAIVFGPQGMSMKDASVALSGTLNVESLNVDSFFTKDFINRAKNSFTFQRSMSSRTSNSRNEILEALETGGMTFADKRLVGLLNTACRSSPCQGDPSEADIVQHWESIFNHLLYGTNIYMKSGDLSDASKTMRGALKMDYGDSGSYGRKVDLLFHVDGEELCVFEFKRNGETLRMMRIQLSKTIRMGRNAECTLPLRGHVCVAGNRPTTEKGPKEFLENDTLDVLLDIVDHLKNMVEIRSPEPEPEQADADEEANSWRDIDTEVILTPQRSSTPVLK